MKTKLNGGAKHIVSLLLLICMLAGIMCGCSAERTQKFTLSPDIITSGKDISLSSTQGGATKNGKIASSGMTTLFIDKTTSSPIIRNQDNLWRSLPKTAADKSDEMPAVLSAEVLHKGQRYLLNSQSDCVKNGKPESVKAENGVKINYILTLNTDGKSVQITVPVTFYVEDGSFFVSVMCNEIKSSDESFVVTKLRLMDYFGSNSEAAEGDFMLVPDNCGAVIDTCNAKADFENLSFKVYGDSEKNNAFIGAYGVKRKNSAFVAMIEEGDSIACVNSAVAAHTGYNRVGPEFEITQTMITEEKDTQQVYLSGESYSDEIRICYRFLDGNNANYSAMAISCREHLIRTGVLSSDVADSTGDLPFVLSTIGEAASPLGKLQGLTNYEQLLDMLTYLKGKGFSNILVRYKGTFTGGLNQSTISKSEMLKTLGSQEQYRELTDYMQAQQMKLFFDLGFTSCSYASTGSGSLARDLSGTLYTADKTNLFGVTSKVGLTAYNKIEDNVISIFPLAKKSSISNICINDASAFLYSDADNGATRADIQKIIKQESASLTTIGDLMVEKGNFYILKNASYISSLPLKCSVEETGFYTSVPFIPLILHATTQYSTEPLNLSGDYQKAMLRCVEYGAMPQFEWCYEDIEAFTPQGEAQPADSEEETTEGKNESQEQNDIIRPYSYSDWATNAYAFYEKANRALGDIRDERMTAHYEVQSGVFCTEYGDTSIYVNYTSEDITIGGVTVPANDFMRVN